MSHDEAYAFGVFNLHLYQGEDAEIELVFWAQDTDEPVPQTGSTFKAEIRHAAEADVVLATFGVDTDEAAEGIVRLTLSASASANLPTQSVWDLRRVDGESARITYPLHGVVHTRANITRPT